MVISLWDKMQGVNTCDARPMQDCLLTPLGNTNNFRLFRWLSQVVVNHWATIKDEGSIDVNNDLVILLSIY